MSLNLFQMIVILGALLLTFSFWYKYRFSFISNFFVGGIILILLCNLDFLDSKGQFTVFTGVFIISSYIILNLSSLFIYLFKNKKHIHIIFPVIIFIIISIFWLFYIHPYGYYKRKTGVLIRMFLAFFPLYSYTYNKKNINRK